MNPSCGDPEIPPLGRRLNETFYEFGNQTIETCCGTMIRNRYYDSTKTGIPEMAKPGVNTLESEMADTPNSLSAKSLNRRELLKLSPLLILGAFAIPRVRDPLLTAGVAFSDWASARWFRRNHLAPTFADSELTPLENFYVNTYDVNDPGVDLGNWTLTVTGDVQRPGEYTLDQIQALPKFTQHLAN